MDNSHSSSSVCINFLDNQWNKKESKLHILPAALEKTTTFKKGTFFAPFYVLEASRELDDYDPETGIDLKDIPVFTENIIEQRGESIEKYLDSLVGFTKNSLRTNSLPVVLGGEHTISLAGIRALKEENIKIDGIVIFDAHPDLYDAYEGERLSHATVTRRIIEEFNDNIPVYLLGVRNFSSEERLCLSSLKNIHTCLPFPGFSELTYRMLKTIGDNIFLSIDLDVLDVKELPEVSNPSPGGIKIEELLSLLRRLFFLKNILYTDIVEFCPSNKYSPWNLLVAFILKKIITYAVEGLDKKIR